MPEPCPSRRRWYQFSTRTLIVVLTIVGVACGWLAREWKFVRDRRAFDVAARATGGGYAFSAQDSMAASWPQPIPDAEYKTRWPPKVPVWRRWLGDEPYGLVMVPDQWTEGEARKTAALFPEGWTFWRGRAVGPVRR